VFILPTMLLYLFFRACLDRRVWKQSLRGGAVLGLTTVVLLLPRVPMLIEKWSAVELYVGTRSVLRGAEPAEMPGILARQVAISVRAFVLLDGSLPGNPRYIPPTAPALEPLTGALYLAGLALSLRRPCQTALWWCMLAPIILVVHSLSQPIPDGARALAALPAMLLFAGLGIDWLVTQPRLGRLALVTLSVAIPASAGWSWLHYVEWQRQPSNALARQPAVEVDEFAAWRETQMAEIRAGRYGFTVDQWHEIRGRNRPAAAAGRAGQSRADTQHRA
jgi:hypothetical protein